MNTFASQLTYALSEDDPGAFEARIPFQPTIPSPEIAPVNALFVNCATDAEIDSLWANLTLRGVVKMELGQYPFSPKFGWVEDEFGISWQLNLVAPQ